MTKGAPFGRTNVLGYLVYLESFWNSRFGYGATRQRRHPRPVDRRWQLCS